MNESESRAAMDFIKAVDELLNSPPAGFLWRATEAERRLDRENRDERARAMQAYRRARAALESALGTVAKSACTTRNDDATAGVLLDVTGQTDLRMLGETGKEAHEHVDELALMLNRYLGAVRPMNNQSILRIRELATRVLGCDEKGAAWLASPSRALGGAIPLQLLKTDAGVERVEHELRQIEYGMPI